MKTTFAAILLVGSAVFAPVRADLLVPETVPTVVYNEPVVYTAPVTYQAPVVYNAPVVYKTVVHSTPVVPVVYSPGSAAHCSTVYNPLTPNVIVAGGCNAGAYRMSLQTTPTVIYTGRTASQYGCGSFRVTGCSGFSRPVVCR